MNSCEGRGKLSPDVSMNSIRKLKVYQVIRKRSPANSGFQSVLKDGVLPAGAGRGRSPQAVVNDGDSMVLGEGHSTERVVKLPEIAASRLQLQSPQLPLLFAPAPEDRYQSLTVDAQVDALMSPRPPSGFLLNPRLRHYMQIRYDNKGKALCRSIIGDPATHHRFGIKRERDL